MAIIQRFSDNERGAIVITGNTLGLSRQRSTQNPGTDNAINQFITTNTALPVPAAWSAIADLSKNQNITFDWTLNSSSANLNMLTGYSVLYAELIWGGMSVSQSSGGNPPVNVSASINNPITLTTPTGTMQITPDPATAQTAEISGAGTFYIRTQDVTNAIAAGGVGTYTVAGVPSAININEASTLNHAGWTLIVAYKNSSLPPRNMNIYVGEELIGSGQTTNVTVDGFLTPPSGTVSARVLVGAQEGDAVLTGDRMLFGPNAGSLVALSGPNNPSNNFFCSQINIGDPNNTNVGQIDVFGSFGGRNANAINGTMITAGRQGWDITNVDGSSNLVNNQSSALVRMTSSGDVYVLNTLGIQIDTILVSGTKTVDKETAVPGDTLNYTVNLTNEGGIPQSATFYDPPPAGTSFVSGSLLVSTTYTGDLVSGIGLINIPPGQTVQIKWQVLIGNTIPDPNPILNTGQIAISGLPVQYTNTVSTRVPNADLSITKSASPDPFIVGELATYTLTINNSGPDPALSVFVNDAVPAPIENAEYSTDGVTWEPWSGLYGFGTLNVGQSQTIMIRGLLTNTNDSEIENRATVSSITPDPNPANNTVTITTPITQSADISVLKMGTSDTVVAGNKIQYQIMIFNAGPSISQNVYLTDNLVPEISTAEYSTNNGDSWNPFVSPLQIGNLGLFETRMILIRGDVSSDATSLIPNQAVVSSDTFDPNLDNNTSDFNTLLTTEADIGVIKTQSDNSPSFGDTLIYTVTVSNAGPSDSENVLLSDYMPDALINQEYSFDQIDWQAWPGSYNFGTLASGDSQTIYLRGVVNDSDIITNTATVSSTSFDPNLNNNSSTIQTEQQDTILTVSKEGVPEPAVAGSLITYTILIDNLTAVDALNVIVSDVLPDSISSPEYSLDDGANWFSWNNSVDVGTVPANAQDFKVLLRGTVLSSATGTIINTVTVTSTNAATATDTEEISISNVADIYVIKDSFPNPITAGQIILYSMTIGNYGPSDSLNVVFRDVIPIGIEDPMISVNYEPFTAWNYPYRLDLGTVHPGAQEIVVLIAGTVSASTTEDVVNVAEVTSDTFDPNMSNNISEYISTVLTSADLRISKSVNVSPIIAGQEIVYEITITNDGISDAQSVLVLDGISNKILNPQYSFSGGVPWTDWLGSLDLGLIANKETVKVYIRGTVDPNATGEIFNEAIVLSSTPDPNPEDNYFEITTAIIQSADISVEKTLLTQKPIAGLPILYRVLVTNNGPSTASDVELSDVIVCNTLGASYSTDGGITWDTWVGSLLIGELGPNEVVEVLISGRICPITTGNMDNTASVKTSTPDPNPNNNFSSITVEVQSLADLAVYKIATPVPAILGQHLVYSISVANFGPSNALQATLTDQIPSFLSFPEVSLDGGVSWDPWEGSVTVPTAVAGSLFTVLIRGRVNNTANGFDIENTATVSSLTDDPNPQNNTSSIITPVRNIADLSIEKSADKDRIYAGESVVYTIVVTNSGPDNAEGVEITDMLPSSLRDSEYSINDVDWEPWTGRYFVNEIPANESFTIRLRGTLANTSEDYIVNTARISSASTDIDPNNDCSTVVTLIEKNPEIELCQRVCTLPVYNNEEIIIQVCIKNTGAWTAENVSFLDALPREICNPQISLDRGRCWMPFERQCFLGEIPAGEIVHVLIKGYVKTQNRKKIYNTVSLLYCGGGESSSICITIFD